MGIDGTLNADFIRAGKIRTNIMEVSFNGMGDLLRMVSGTLQLWNDDLKIMELTKRGMEFWRIEVNRNYRYSWKSFPNLVVGSENGQPIMADMDGKALQLRLDNGGDYVLISSSEGKGLVLGKTKVCIS